MNKVLALVFGTLVVTGCSDVKDDDALESGTKAAKTISTDVVESDNFNLEGAWAFCSNKSLTKDDVEKGCLTTDALLWQFEDGDLVVSKVLNGYVTENCNTTCVDPSAGNLEVEYVARAEYRLEGDAVHVEVVDSTDEVNFPLCPVKWNILDKGNNVFINWQLENVGCADSAIINFKTWVRKIN